MFALICIYSHINFTICAFFYMCIYIYTCNVYPNRKPGSGIADNSIAAGAVRDGQAQSATFAPAKMSSERFSASSRHKVMLHHSLALVGANGAQRYIVSLYALDGVMKVDALAARSVQVPADEYNQEAVDKSVFRCGILLRGAAFCARKKANGAWRRSSGVHGDDSDAPDACSEQPHRHNPEPST